jgi:hypothetical protein
MPVNSSLLNASSVLVFEQLFKALYTSVIDITVRIDAFSHRRHRFLEYQLGEALCFLGSEEVPAPDVLPIKLERFS